MKKLISLVLCFSIEAEEADYQSDCKNDIEVKGYYDKCLNSEDAKKHLAGPNDYCMNKVNKSCPDRIGSVSAGIQMWGKNSEHEGYASLPMILKDVWQSGKFGYFLDRDMANRLIHETSLPLEIQMNGYWLPQYWFDRYPYYMRTSGFVPCLDVITQKEYPKCKVATYTFYGFNKSYK